MLALGVGYVAGLSRRPVFLGGAATERHLHSLRAQMLPPSVRRSQLVERGDRTQRMGPTGWADSTWGSRWSPDHSGNPPALWPE